MDLILFHGCIIFHSVAGEKSCPQFPTVGFWLFLAFPSHFLCHEQPCRDVQVGRVALAGLRAEELLVAAPDLPIFNIWPLPEGLFKKFLWKVWKQIIIELVLKLDLSSQLQTGLRTPSNLEIPAFWGWGDKKTVVKEAGSGIRQFRFQLFLTLRPGASYFLDLCLCSSTHSAEATRMSTVPSRSAGDPRR